MKLVEVKLCNWENGQGADFYVTHDLESNTHVGVHAMDEETLRRVYDLLQVRYRQASDVQSPDVGGVR